MNSVFDVAYGVLSDVNSVNSLLDSVQTILDDDVNITDISAGITVRQGMIPEHWFAFVNTPLFWHAHVV